MGRELTRIHYGPSRLVRFQLTVKINSLQKNKSVVAKSWIILFPFVVGLIGLLGILLNQRQVGTNNSGSLY
jgi:hypothetical protein